jgi:hypothetical protein
MPTDYVDRPLDAGESFFFLADRVSCMNFVMIAERSGALDPSRIAAGLARLQQENPLLESRITWADASGLRFEPAAGELVSLDCRATEPDGWQAWIELELARPFGLGDAPLMRCQYLHWSNTNGEPECVLALTFHHAISDGRSGAELLRRLLAFLAAGAAFERRAATVLPPMAESFPEPFRWSGRPDAARQAMEQMLAGYGRHGRVQRLCWLVASASERAPRFIRITLPPAITQRLLDLSRQHGASVHGALCAAQLLAQARVSATGKREVLFLSCPVDMRPHLEPVPPAVPTGLYISLVSAAYVVEQTTAFWALAREVIEQTRAQLARGEGHLFFNLYRLAGKTITPAFEPGFAKALLATFDHTAVSNIGRVTPVLNDPAVHAISFALSPMPYQALFSCASTYEGQLIINVNYDAGRVTAPLAQSLADTMQEILLREGDGLNESGARVQSTSDASRPQAG